MPKMTPTYVVAITGASGVIYAIRLLKALVQTPCRVILMVSQGGFRVLDHEMGFTLGENFQEFLADQGVVCHHGSTIRIFNETDYAASPASGSFVHSGMVVVPCSMKSLAAMAAGYADNLISRSADVCLKERRPLILVPRETPLSLIHLENMTRICRAGATILPPCPSFYTSPATVEALVDTVTARILDHLNLNLGHDLVPRWCNGTEQ
ncbi:MAG: flavin prenyltransferase UbiX [Desulfobacterium sp.]|nr:flavin prenyltransferase UbiX [Desulfobacterium sp.]